MKFSLLLGFVLLAACSSHKTYNQAAVGKVTLLGGVSKKLIWDDPLILKRMSWYHGMTLYYDALLWKADLNSPFVNWFSPAEKEFFTKCENFIVTAEYSADPTKISHVSFREQMKLNGYDDVVLNTFAYSFKGHPSAIDWRLQNYKVNGYCKRSASWLNSKKLIVNFPSFKQLEINL